MPYDFSDPQLRQSLAETDPDPRMQFDPRALFELLRRRGRAKLLTNDLNNEVDRQGGLSFYNSDQSGMVGHQTGNVSVDPLNDRDVQGLYDLEDASPFKMSGFRGAGAQEVDKDPSFMLDMRGGFSGGPSYEEGLYGKHHDPYNMQLEEPSPMAQHATKKQPQYAGGPASTFPNRYSQPDRLPLGGGFSGHPPAPWAEDTLRGDLNRVPYSPEETERRIYPTNYVPYRDRIFEYMQSRRTG